MDLDNEMIIEMVGAGKGRFFCACSTQEADLLKHRMRNRRLFGDPKAWGF